MRSRPYNHKSVILVDNSMPETFDPFTICLAYLEGQDSVNIADTHFQDEEIVKETMSYTSGYWWVPKNGRIIENLVYHLSMKGIGLVVYASKEAMKDYHKEIEP